MSTIWPFFPDIPEVLYGYESTIDIQAIREETRAIEPATIAGGRVVADLKRWGELRE
jgi:hypothetical protein